MEKLGRLREYCSSKVVQVQQFALGAQMSVYRDIIPSYRIRPLTDIEENMKITKEVKKLRNYEQALVRSYKSYAEMLRLVVFGKAGDRLRAKETRSTALQCVCELLKSVSHFNFRSDLLDVVITLLCRKKSGRDFEVCLETLHQVLAEDDSGNTSLDAVHILSKKLALQKYKMSSLVLDAFLHLQFLSDATVERAENGYGEVAKHMNRKSIPHLNKREKKLRAEQKKIDAEIAEAETAVSKEERERLQSECLKLVFSTYIHVLRNGDDLSLLGSALEGLSKYAHLINIDLFGDLLQVLHELLRKFNELTQSPSDVRPLLLCIVAAFTLLSGQAEKLNLDLQDFVDNLYGLLYPLSANISIESRRHFGIFTGDSKSTNVVDVSTEGQMMMTALETVSFNQRKPSNLRIAAFLRRLLVSCLYFPEKTAFAALDFAGRVVQRYGSTSNLFSTDDKIGNGIYNADTDFPEASNPFASTAWEVFLLERHYAPEIQRSAKALRSVHKI